MPFYLLKEDSSRLVLESDTGSVLLELEGSQGTGVLLAASSSADGVGEVTGLGPPPSTRRHAFDLDVECIVFKQ